MDEFTFVIQSVNRVNIPIHPETAELDSVFWKDALGDTVFIVVHTTQPGEPRLIAYRFDESGAIHQKPYMNTSSGKVWQHGVAFNRVHDRTRVSPPTNQLCLAEINPHGKVVIHQIVVTGSTGGEDFSLYAAHNVLHDVVVCQRGDGSLSQPDLEQYCPGLLSFLAPVLSLDELPKINSPSRSAQVMWYDLAIGRGLTRLPNGGQAWVTAKQIDGPGLKHLRRGDVLQYEHLASYNNNGPVERQLVGASLCRALA